MNFFHCIKEKKILLIGFILLILFSCSMFLAYKNEWHFAMAQPQIIQAEGDVSEIKIDDHFLINDTQVVSQDIPFERTQEIQSIALYLDGLNIPDKTSLQIDLLKNPTNELLKSIKYNLSEQKKVDFSVFTFDKPILFQTDEILTVRLSLISNADNELYVISVPNNSASHTTLHIDSTKTNNIIPYQLTNGNYVHLKFFAFAFYIGGTLAILGICISCAKKRTLEWIFVECAFILGLLYLFILPPFSVPDEQSHFATAYVESSKILGEPTLDPEGKILIPSDAWNHSNQASKNSYLHFIHGTLNKTDSSEVLISTRTPLPTLHPGYFPQIAGITFARLLHLNSIQLLLVGRLFALTWYCFIMFWAIRFIPFGKATLFLIGILPMTLQQVVSYNYDSLLFGLCFFLFSYLLKLIYKDTKITYKNIIIIAGLIISLASLKFVYLPILILALFIPYSKFGSKRKKWILAGSSVGIGIVTILLTRMTTMQNALATGEGAIGGTKISLDYCLQNPSIVLQTFFRTIERKTSDYFFQMMGSSLGWLDTFVPQLIAVISIIFILISTLRRKSDTLSIPTSMKYASIATFLGISAIIFSVLFLDWTSIGDSLIQGMQGRYFLPILPMIYIIAQNRNITIQKEIDHYLILFSTYLNCMALFHVTLYALSR